MTSQRRPPRAFQLSTFHYSISGHDEHAASSRVVSKIPSKHTAWVAFHLQLLLLPQDGNRRIPQILQRASSKHVQNVASQPSTISPNPEETDRICCHPQYPLQDGMGLNDLSSCASRANFRVRVCRFTSRMADSATPLEACSPTGLSRKTNSTNGVASKVAVLRATIDGSPSLCKSTRRYPSRRNVDTNHDVAHSVTPRDCRQVAAYFPVFTSFPTRMSSLFFVSFRRRRHLLCHKASNNHTVRQVTVTPLIVLRHKCVRMKVIK